MDNNWSLFLVIPIKLEIEPLRQLEIQLYGGQLVAPFEGVENFDVDFGAVKRPILRIQFPLCLGSEPWEIFFFGAQQGLKTLSFLQKLKKPIHFGKSRVLSPGRSGPHPEKIFLGSPSDFQLDKENNRVY